MMCSPVALEWNIVPCVTVRPSHDTREKDTAESEAISDANESQKALTCSGLQVALRLSIQISAKLEPPSSSACMASYMPPRLCAYPPKVIPAKTPTNTIKTTATSRSFVRQRLRAKRLFSRFDIPRPPITLLHLNRQSFHPR